MRNVDRSDFESFPFKKAFEIDLSDFFSSNAIFHKSFESINTSNSSVPITATFGTRIEVSGYFLSSFASLSKLLAKAKPLALPPNEPVEILTKLNFLLVVSDLN